jgi:hypothetical protein
MTHGKKQNAAREHLAYQKWPGPSTCDSQIKIKAPASTFDREIRAAQLALDDAEQPVLGRKLSDQPPRERPGSGDQQFRIWLAHPQRERTESGEQPLRI